MAFNLNMNQAGQQFAQPGNEMSRIRTGLDKQAKRPTNPYSGGLQTNFSDTGQTLSRGGRMYDTGTSYDADVRNAQAITNEMAHPDSGSSQDELRARLNLYKSRIGIKNSLAEQIAGADQMEKEGANNLRLGAGEALGEGLKHTRENYNKRGLLYSGLRESGEGQVRGAVAGQLASGLAGNKRESQNAKEAAQNAYAAVGLQNQQEHLQLAHEAFETATANSVARMQAMQQLGGGIGSVLGTMYGMRGGGGAPDSQGVAPSNGARMSEF